MRTRGRALRVEHSTREPLAATRRQVGECAALSFAARSPVSSAGRRRLHSGRVLHPASPNERTQKAARTSVRSGTSLPKRCANFGNERQKGQLPRPAGMTKPSSIRGCLNYDNWASLAKEDEPFNRMTGLVIRTVSPSRISIIRNGERPMRHFRLTDLVERKYFSRLAKHYGNSSLAPLGEVCESDSPAAVPC